MLQCALLANSAGVGGGPFYVPLLNVVVGFSLQECTGLSHRIVATSAIASTLYGLTHPRPGHPDRPLVDLDVALIFIPALLFGVSIGEPLDSAVAQTLCSSPKCLHSECVPVSNGFLCHVHMTFKVCIECCCYAPG